MISDDSSPELTGIVEDDRLRPISTCCHPALAPEARVALTLRLLGGLTVAEKGGQPLPRVVVRAVIDVGEHGVARRVMDSRES